MTKKIFIFFLLLLAFTSCERYIDVVPDNVATIDYAFRNKVGAEKFMASCYTYLPSFGDINADPAIMGSDEIWSFMGTTDMTDNYSYDILLNKQTSNTPYDNYWTGEYNGKKLFQGIRNCNTFLENADNVGPELQGTELARWKAEVKFLKAYYHYYLLRMYGSIPLIRMNLPVSSGIEQVRTYREPFDTCVNYIKKLIDEAIPDLPTSIVAVSTEMGRITQPLALSIKAEMLVMAASPLFNGNPDYANLKDNRGVSLFPGSFDKSKWDTATVACKKAIESSEAAGNQLYQFTETAYPLSDSTRTLQSLRCAVSDKWNKEIIWGNTQNSGYNYTYFTLPYFTTDNTLNNPWRGGMVAPSLKMAEAFYSNHGVPIEEDATYDYDNRYKTDVTPANHKFYIQSNFRTAKLNMNREPRFYANLCFDGGYWYGNGRYKDIGKGTAAETQWPILMKRGNTSGKITSLRYSITGYVAKKPAHYQSIVSPTSATSAVFVRYAFPIMRLADLYLLYAEALNESLDVPNAQVYAYVDKVRTRAGLMGVVNSWNTYSKFPTKPSTQAGMRDIIHRERTNELCFEGKRFWDIRRWKTAITELNKTVNAWNVQGDNEADYYRIIPIGTLTFTTKNYLWPIKDQDIRVNRNLVQNIYW